MSYKFILIIFSTLLFSTKSYTQVYNKSVAAKIFTKSENDVIYITGSAFNKTEIDQSLYYVLSVIKNNPNNSNRSKNEQRGRFVLNSGQKKELSSTTLNLNSTEKDRVIVLLLIYNIDDEIVGKDRIVFNDHTNNEDVILKEKLSKQLKETDVDENNDDGIVLRGIVLQDIKTKPARDFYKIFYSDYTLQQINSKQIIEIEEVFILSNRTVIRVLVGDKLVYRFLAQSQEDYLKKNSKEAIMRVNKYLVYLEKNKNSIQHY